MIFERKDVGFLLSIVLEIKPGASYTLDKCFTRELPSQPRSTALEGLFPHKVDLVLSLRVYSPWLTGLQASDPMKAPLIT